MAQINNIGIKLGQSIVGGLIGTLVMTGLILIAPKLGLPEMNIGSMLSQMMNVSEGVGWIIHFIIGMTGALAFCLVIRNLMPMENNFFAGIVFGLLMFISTQLAMKAMIIASLVTDNGGGIKAIIGSMIGHILYGLCLGYFIRKDQS